MKQLNKLSQFESVQRTSERTLLYNIMYQDDGQHLRHVIFTINITIKRKYHFPRARGTFILHNK